MQPYAAIMEGGGIVEVFVNGCSVWRDGHATGDRPGRALRLQQLGQMGGGMAAS